MDTEKIYFIVILSASLIFLAGILLAASFVILHNRKEKILKDEQQFKIF